MSSPLVIPAEYKYVLASLLPNAFLLLAQNVIVGRYRRKAGIAYPQPYAEKAEALASRDAHLFNCAQRAHQNTLETLPIVLIIICVSGLTFPKSAASVSMIWVAARILYTRGYLTGDPAKRGGNLVYHASTLGTVGLLLASTVVAVRWVIPGL